MRITRTKLARSVTVAAVAVATAHAVADAPAHAAEGRTTVSLSSFGLLQIEAVAVRVDNLIFIKSTADGMVVSDFRAGVDPLPGSTCIDISRYSVRCDRTAFGAVSIKSHDGDDTVSAVNAYSVDPLTIRIEGGSGDDDITGSAGADVLLGGPGDDGLRGLDGDDRLYGGDLASTSADGADTFSGNGDYDTVFYSGRVNGVIVTTGDTVRNDGEVGEGDLVLSNVEDVRGGKGDDRLEGASGRANRLYGNGGDDILDVNDGDTADFVNGGDFFSPGHDVCRVDVLFSGGIDHFAQCEVLVRVYS